MTRTRQPTEAMLARRANAAARYAAMKAARDADPTNPRNIRKRLARQIVQALQNLPEPPPDDHPEMLAILRNRRLATNDLYGARDRALNFRAAQDRLNARYAPAPKETPNHG